MSAGAIFSLASTIVLVVLVILVVISRRARRHGSDMQAGVIGAMYEMHNRDRQKALEIIVKGKAAARRPEYPDENLPAP